MRIKKCNQVNYLDESFFTLTQNVQGQRVIAKSSNPYRIGVIAATLAIGLISETIAAAQTFAPEAIRAAFKDCHDGYSSDELLIRDDLRDSFLSALGDGTALDDDQQRVALLTLLKLRKTGKLSVRATKRGRPVEPNVHPVAEIASRAVTDRHRITSDTLLADPDFRRELQQEAELISPGIDPYSVRKSVLALRKKRSLRPELVLQVAQWGREVTTQSLAGLRLDLKSDKIPKLPGIYLFRNSDGYLYIGEAADLSARLTQHVTESDRQSLAEFLSGDDADGVTVELHIFAADSPAAKVNLRRAYESELIRSRHPKFNVRP
jgi:hypothetical protein